MIISICNAKHKHPFGLICNPFGLICNPFGLICNPFGRICNPTAIKYKDL